MIELVPDTRELSLAMREADISVRLTPSEQHDLVIRRIGRMDFGLYASPDYLDRHGELDFEDGCPGHHLITQIDDIQGSTQAGWLAQLAPRARVALQTSSHEAAVTAAANGGGLGCLARFRADREAGLVRLAAPSEVPKSGIWLVAHKDNCHNARIRAALNHITEGVRKLADQLSPGDTGARSNR
jgi:DNA-binding transcriptional LysR family regulator